LSKKISLSLDLFPCDLLFVHRDTDRETTDARKEEIFKAIEQISEELKANLFVCVIPVRMTEAWL